MAYRKITHEQEVGADVLEKVRNERQRLEKPLVCPFKKFAEEHFPGMELEMTEKMVLWEAYHIKRLVVVRNENLRWRKFARLKGESSLLYIRKTLSDVLLQYTAAGYTTLELFQNAVLAVYPQSDINFKCVWEVQRFDFNDIMSFDVLDKMQQVERALVVLTQKPGWL